jgi:putative membrane protein
MSKIPDDPTGLRGLLDKAQDAVGAMVGMASATTLGPHDAETYVTSASVSDLYEIEAGRLALQRSESPQVRRYAQMLIEDHSRAAEVLLLKAKLAGLEMAAEPRLDERRKGMLDNLQTAPAETFDQTFLAQQIAAHKEAVALHKGYSENGANEVLRGLASGAAPALEQHLEMARHLSGQL